MATKINYRNYWSVMQNRLDPLTNMYYREYKERVLSIYPHAHITWGRRKMHPNYKNDSSNPFTYIIFGSPDYWIQLGITCPTNQCISLPRQYEHSAWKSAWQQLKKLENVDEKVE